MIQIYSPENISTHILTKRMTVRGIINAKRPNISTHILTKRMTHNENLFAIVSSISTHILTKRMTSGRDNLKYSPRHFNSHPHEEDDNVELKNIWERMHFNSHPHEEDDRKASLKDCLECISTHILTKRMTLTQKHLKINRIISTHILTKRMTAILNKNNLFKIAYYINNKHFISIVDIFFHFHIYF